MYKGRKINGICGINCTVNYNCNSGDSQEVSAFSGGEEYAFEKYKKENWWVNLADLGITPEAPLEVAEEQPQEVPPSKGEPKTSVALEPEDQSQEVDRAVAARRAELSEMLETVLKTDLEQAHHIITSHFYPERDPPPNVPPTPILQPTEEQFKQFLESNNIVAIDTEFSIEMNVLTRRLAYIQLYGFETQEALIFTYTNNFLHLMSLRGICQLYFMNGCVPLVKSSCWLVFIY